MLSRFLTVREQFILVFFGVSILAGAGVLLYQGNRAEHSPAEPEALAIEAPAESGAKAAPPAALEPSAPATQASASEAQQSIAVGIVGAVRRPGLYRVPPGSRLGHLLEAAGGASDAADLAGIDLLRPLQDGVTIEVPARKNRQP